MQLHKTMLFLLSLSLLVACGGEGYDQNEAPADAPPPPAAEAASSEETSAELQVSDAEVMVLPGGMGAGYLRVQGGAAADRLVSVSTPASQATETHESVDADGVMKMEPRPDGFEVPAGGELVLEQGGKHIMFHGIEVAADVSELELTLQFAEAGERKIAAAVKRPGDADHGGMDHGDMDHGSMDHGSMDHGEMDHGEMDHGEMDHGEMDHGGADQ